MTVSTYTFNTLTEGAAVPNGFGGSDGSGIQMYSSLGGGDTWTAAAAAAYEGAMGGVLTHNSPYSGYITWASNASLSQNVRGAGSVFTRMRALPSGTAEGLFGYGNAAVSVLLRPTGEVYAVIGTSPAVTTIRNIATVRAGQWLFIQAAVTVSSTDGHHRVELNVYTGGTTPGSDLTAQALSYDSGAALTFGYTAPEFYPFRAGRIAAPLASVEGTTVWPSNGIAVDYDSPATDNAIPSGFPGHQPVVVAPLTNTTLPAISGSLQVGATLTASPGTWIATPDGYSYQWKRAGAPLAGATTATYTVTSADIGQPLTVTVVATKSGWTSGTATSAAVTPPPLTNTLVPDITGTAQVGLTLTASPGTWTPTPDGFTYQWRRAGTLISGATSTAYTVTDADAGQPLTVTVTATKTGYPAASASSSAVTGIAAPVAPPVTIGAGAYRRWFLGSDDYWRAYGIDTPVPDGNTVGSTLVARFTVNSAGKTITVDGTSSTATASTITGYAWDFGDGTTATGAHATHTYATAGSFTVALTVTDDRNTTAAVQQTVTMSAPNADFTWTAAGSVVAFDASTSTDVGSTIRTYGWNFGDGATGTGVTVSHTYATAGTRTVTLTVTDNAGVVDTEAEQVSVALPTSAPVAAFTVAVSNQVATFDLSASSTTNATITRFDLTFGDGPTWVGNGVGRTVTHPYAVGTFTATLKVTDSQGHTATVSHPVTVAAPPNSPPVAAFTATPSGLKVAFSAVTSSDGDGTIGSYAWTFGDGGTGTGVTPTHDYTAGGPFTVRLTVTDNLGAQAAATKTLTLTAPNTDIEYLASTTATKSTTLVPSSTSAVTQHFNRSVDTGEFYSSQTHKESDGVTESVRLSRIRTDGTLIDQMFLTYAGHGSMFELEYVGTTMYIWLTWQRNSLGGAVVNDWVRFPYKAGTYTRSQVAGLTVKIAGPTYRLYAFDHEAGYACVRTTTATTETFRRYPIGNVMAGNLTGQVGKTLTLTMSPPTPQGFATYYDSLFRYVGAPTDDPDWATDQPTLTEHSWTSGNTVKTLDMAGYLGTGRGEPESVAVYNTGTKPVLFFGFSYGPVGGPHTYPTWWFPLKDQTTTTPPPVTTPGGSGDNGINQTGVAGRQQTGTGVKDYSSLTGSTVGAKINAAGTGNIASMPAGTFTLTNFKEAWGGTANGSACIAGASVNAGIKGLYGAGSASTKIVLPAGTPPALESGATTNQHYLMAFKSVVASGFIIDGVTLQGAAAKTNDFGGIWTQGSTNLTISNTTIKGVVGSAGAPPGETFVFNLYSHASGTATFSHVTFEGSGLGAAGLGTNSTSGTINIDNCVASNFPYSAGIATWENRGTINVRNLRMVKNHRNFGAETNAGTINVTNPIWGDHASGGHDFNITWTNNYGDGFINVYFTTATDWQNFIGPRTVKKITVVTNTHQVYGGSAGGAYTGTGDIWKNFRVYVAGVQQTTTNYVTFTGNHVA